MNYNISFQPRTRTWLDVVIDDVTIGASSRHDAIAVFDVLLGRQYEMYERVLVASRLALHVGVRLALHLLVAPDALLHFLFLFDQEGVQLLLHRLEHVL